jgi:hypothetical protein
MPHPPRPTASPARRPPRAAVDESGQAAVELVAALPLVAVVLALAWQAVLAGHAAWAAAAAARAGARAAALGGDPQRAATARLDAGLARDARVHDDGAGHVRVSVAIPTLSRALHLGRLDAEATFRPQAGS